MSFPYPSLDTCCIEFLAVPSVTELGVVNKLLKTGVIVELIADQPVASSDLLLFGSVCGDGPVLLYADIYLGLVIRLG